MACSDTPQRSGLEFARQLGGVYIRPGAFSGIGSFLIRASANAYVSGAFLRSRPLVPLLSPGRKGRTAGVPLYSSSLREHSDGWAAMLAQKPGQRVRATCSKEHKRQEDATSTPSQGTEPGRLAGAQNVCLQLIQMGFFLASPSEADTTDLSKAVEICLNEAHKSASATARPG